MSQPTPSDPDPETEGTEEAAGLEYGDVGVSDGETDGDGETAVDLRTLWLDSEDAGDLISSLSSDTARSIVVSLHERPATASELAEAVDTSVQNVRHHLDNLQEAGIVEVSDMRYSPKGREMDVYAPVDEQMVVFVGSQDDSDAEADGSAGFVDSLRRFLGAVGVLAAASVLVDRLLRGTAVAAGGAGYPRGADALGPGGSVPAGVAPGLLFFAGGALILAVAASWRYWERRE